jgi:hypothetical protein
MAEMRLACTERKMDKDPSYADLYCAKLKEYEDKKFIRKLTKEEAGLTTPRTWYLPHFGVVHPNRPGKFRLCFDAAAKTQGVSLNDYLVKGPDLMQPLQWVLWKFRENPIAFTGDIRDMFHQVAVRPEDRHSQRFLWRGKDRTNPADVWVMEVMTFGATCSPCSATYVKDLNAEQLKEEFPDSWKDVITRHYVDDYLGGAETTEEAIRRIADVINIHQRGGFHICKWTSNCREALQQIPVELRIQDLVDLSPEKELPEDRVLGIAWNPEADIFTFRLMFHKVPKEVLNNERTPTKREILKLVMSIYDPLGFASHFTTKGKLLLQDIWRSGIGWDDELTKEQEKSWDSWMMELKRITEVEIPRCYSKPFLGAEEVQLHVFCDASERAFCTIAFFRIKSAAEVTTAFVCSRTRVAPLKPLSIPRLELQAAVMGARLSKVIREGHTVRIASTVFWTDSRTVMCWIRADARRFKQFVSHRVGEIHELTDVEQWRWLPTKTNVADEATRDSVPCDFKPNSRWYRGPSFLTENENSWPKEDLHKVHNTDELELRNVVMTTMEVQPLIDITRFSNWMRLIRSTAYMFRFIRRPSPKGELTVEEIFGALYWWIRREQHDSFPEEVSLLQQALPIPKGSRLYKLTPAIDKNGILRLRGRLENWKDGDGPRNNWPLGRIIQTYPGKDGQVRVADVKTKTGTYRRPVIKLIKLDVDPVSHSFQDRGEVLCDDTK